MTVKLIKFETPEGHALWLNPAFVYTVDRYRQRAGITRVMEHGAKTALLVMGDAEDVASQLMGHTT